jgi:hypothetical protein
MHVLLFIGSHIHQKTSSLTVEAFCKNISKFSLGLMVLERLYQLKKSLHVKVLSKIMNWKGMNIPLLHKLLMQ